MAPPEIVIEQSQYGGYLWFICQPDQCWGIWDQCSHKYADNKDAFSDAQIALIKVCKQLGL